MACLFIGDRSYLHEAFSPPDDVALFSLLQLLKQGLFTSFSFIYVEIFRLFPSQSRTSEAQTETGLVVNISKQRFFFFYYLQSFYNNTNLSLHRRGGGEERRRLATSTTVRNLSTTGPRLTVMVWGGGGGVTGADSSTQRTRVGHVFTSFDIGGGFCVRACVLSCFISRRKR